MSFVSDLNKAVLARDKNIRQVVNPEIITSVVYSEENSKKIDAILAHGKIADLQTLPIATMDDEMIIVVKFFDEKNRKFFVSLYDNGELWHNSTILKIYEVLE